MARSRHQASSTRVLVVSDDPINMLPLVRALMNDGYDVVSWRSVERMLGGLRRMRGSQTLPAELLVLDASRRSDSIVEVLEAVRASDWSLPIVLLAADDETQAAAERYGVASCLRAPADLATMRAAVAHVAPPVLDVAV